MGNTKEDGQTRYRGGIVSNEQPRDGLLEVLADHSTDGRKKYPVDMVGNCVPRDPSQGRRSRVYDLLERTTGETQSSPIVSPETQ
ncbi:MAG: hypothetical protein OEM02_11295 [Desulfobulbaceae bacterium]|nr:hypothetical protein [Desulfobulbaceae bacterium]